MLFGQNYSYSCVSAAIGGFGDVLFGREGRMRKRSRGTSSSKQDAQRTTRIERLDKMAQFAGSGLASPFPQQASNQEINPPPRSPLSREKPGGGGGTGYREGVEHSTYYLLFVPAYYSLHTSAPARQGVVSQLQSQVPTHRPLSLLCKYLCRYICK